MEMFDPTAYYGRVNEQMRERGRLERRAKDLSDREILTLSALGWMKSLREQFPGLVAGRLDLTDEELYRRAGRIVDVTFGAS